MAEARIYDLGLAAIHQAEAVVLDLDGLVTQVSVLPSKDGFLIRSWPQDGTHEHGGNNMTVLSAVVRNGKVEQLDIENNKDA